MNASPLAAPVLTGLDALTQAIGAVVYLGVGLGAWLHAPRDIRTRVFLGLALASVVTFAPEALAYARGLRDPATMPRILPAAVLSGLCMGALLLFHLTQVFPRRRAWIRAAGPQMGVAYVLTPFVVSGLVWFVPKSLADMSQVYVIALLVFGLPLLVLLGFILPVAAIVSLARSYRECHAAELSRARGPIAWILISQIAGGALAVVFAPVLAVVAPNSAAQTVMTLIIWSIGLLTPIAFAAAVWKLDVLSIDPWSV